MEKAILVMLELVRNLVEDAGASPLAAALKIKEKIAGKKVALIITGGNLSVPRLRGILGT
jgi:threonine dehydratase